MGSNKKASTHQVQNGSPTGHTSPSKNQKAKQKGKGTARSWKRRVWTKLEASLWVTGAAFFLWRGDGIYNLPDVIRLDDNVDRKWLYTGTAFLALHFLIFLYLRLWLQWYRGIEDWVKAAPVAIPLSIVCLLSGGVMLAVALWVPLGYLSPLAVAVCLMGAVVAPHLIPSWLPLFGCRQSGHESGRGVKV